jgi:hypothetical protein
MKIFYFTKWLSNRVIDQVMGFDRWMWAWGATCFFGSMFASADKGTVIYDVSRSSLIVLIVGFWFGYGLVYTGIKTAWKKFNSEQQQMLKHLEDIGP